MKILDKAAALEKALLRRISRRTDIRRHPIELYRAILDDIEDASEPGARGTRIFPYNHITVWIATSGAHHRATAEAVFAEPPSIEERVCERLRQRDCTLRDPLVVTVKFADGGAETWAGREYRLEYRRRAAARQAVEAAPTKAGQQELHLTVLAGTAAKQRYSFSEERINLGRLAEVLDRHHRVLRQNHVVFLDGDDESSQSVSRAHGHIQFVRATADARLHDDGSTHGTRIVREGRTIHVPRSSGRGIKLCDGDEVILGHARMRVELRPSRRS